MRKRIVFLDQSLSGGGAERVLCTILRSLDSGLFDIHLVIVSSLSQLAHLVPSYVAVHELGISNTWKALPAFIRLMHEVRPDVVFSSLSRTTVLAAAARFFCPRYFLIGRYPTMPGPEIQEGIVRGWRLFLMRVYYKKVDLVVSQTQEMEDDLCTILRISRDRVVTIPNPIDVEQIDRLLVNQDSPYCNDEINIVAVGSLSQVKGFDSLLTAFQLALKKRRQLRLHFVGRDTEENDGKLQKMTRDLGVEAQVTFHGFQQNPYRFIRFCDLFVISSRREGFPNALLEALYLERPVLATRCAPIIDRLLGQSGVVVDVDDVEGMAVGMLDHDSASVLPSSFQTDMRAWESIFNDCS